MINLDNLKPAWKQYQYIIANFSDVNEEDILDMISHEKTFSVHRYSRLLMNACMSLLIICCCTGC